MTDLPPDVAKIVTVAEGLYVRQAVDNMAWIDMGEWGLAVDALEQDELEGEVFRAIGETLDERPMKFLLNTHTHYDHTALNSAFRRRGAEVVNAKICDIPPEGRQFEGSNRTAVMIPLGGCHTREDCIVHLPQDGVLFVGDLFGWGLIPSETVMDDAMARRLLDVYERMIQLDASVVIPGHGPLCTTDELRRWVKYFRWLVGEAHKAAQQGGNETEIAARIPAPKDMSGWWRFNDWKHADSVAKVVHAVRGGKLKEL